jgi:hypothetical protein
MKVPREKGLVSPPRSALATRRTESSLKGDLPSGWTIRVLTLLAFGRLRSFSGLPRRSISNYRDQPHERLAAISIAELSDELFAYTGLVHVATTLFSSPDRVDPSSVGMWRCAKTEIPQPYLQSRTVPKTGQ